MLEKCVVLAENGLKTWDPLGSLDGFETFQPRFGTLNDCRAEVITNSRELHNGDKDRQYRDADGRCSRHVRGLRISGGMRHEVIKSSQLYLL